ncbi:phospholipid phosphatase 4 isoform X2 [Haematobia irritans]
MFSGSSIVNENSRRLFNVQQQQQRQSKSSNYDTYPPKKSTSSLRPHHAPATNNSEKIKNTMSTRQSPGRFYTKRSSATTTTTRRSYSESSAEKQLHKYSSSDSSQEEDENLMNMTVDKRKPTRRSIGNGLQYSHHRYKNKSGEDDGVADCCTIFGENSQHISDLIDIAIRVLLVVVFSKMETQTAFKRIIHMEEMWMYKNPRTKDIVSPISLLVSVIIGPFLVSLVHFALTKDRKDFFAASWTWTLILGLNGLATSLLKITVGRPRPDFFYRCFPDGVMHLSNNATGMDNMIDLFNCTGSINAINEGRKSFPSGHSSFAFAGFGFITYYVGAKLHAFNYRGRGRTWRLFISIAPLILAALVAISRTCDYHHHWEDVTVGSIIGLFVSYYVYRQYYPSIFSTNCHRPYSTSRSGHSRKIKEPEVMASRHTRRRLLSYKRLPTEERGDALLSEEPGQNGFANETEKRPLINEQKTDNKWF